MTELEVYNKFEEDVRKAKSLQELEEAGDWLAGAFQTNPEYKETLRKDLGIIYKKKRFTLSTKRSKR